MAIAIPPQPPLSLANSHHMKLQSFTKKFNRLYDQFYLHRDVDKPLLTEISNTLISMDLFDKITLHTGTVSHF